MKKSKILVLGASGFIGQQILQDWGAWAVGTHKHTELKNTVYFDPLTMRISKIQGIERCSHAVILFGEREPDRCWEKPEYTYQLNVESTKQVIIDCFDLGIVPVFASSEMVFSGHKCMSDETDPPDPILIYGKYKVEIEKFIIENLNHYIIFRLSKVMGMKKNDRSIFANWLTQTELISTNRIRCAKDQFFSLIGVSDVAKLLRTLIEENVSGIFHFSNGVRHNRLELLELFLSEYTIATKLEFVIEPVSINDFDLPEVRPLDLSLSNEKLMSLRPVEFTSPVLHIRQLLRYGTT